MRAGALAALLLLAFAGLAAAEAPERSPLPRYRPGPILSFPEVETTADAIAETVAQVIRRRAPFPARVVEGGSGIGRIARSPRPESRPQNVRRRGAVRRAGFPVDRQAGPHSICGDPEILGTTLPAIPGRIAGCGVDEPVRLVSVAGLRLSQAATVDCRTAGALKTWVEDGVGPVVGRLGGGAVGLRVVAHYACRPRNNVPGAKISEHGRGRAIDIAAIRLRNGVEISVLKGWEDEQHGPLLHQLHEAACGPFGTVLGPESDAMHQDHFHFDTARYRSGSYCR
ncbi:hypothetical protein LX81_02564 [Palleronia aestuarii]|uniref:Extensin-like C-terminal domain-containing protein n=1 Tax=Palleronia aestuarii TaxID=568105 RepID=A0A2W7N5A8_9RHOB|nr:extensin family protein [Palleronia aestuarii]PZX15261.1 hypothetical protein LX81_02564 [Palleronia aestuarii]